MPNKCTWWLVYSALVYLIVYQIPKVCLELMYMQHNHMVYDKLHILPLLVLDQNENDNAYSTPLHHEVWNVEQKIIIPEIDLCYNKSSHLCVQRQNYPEHDTLCLSIYFHERLFRFPLINDTIFLVLFIRCSWSSWAKLTSYFSVPVCIWICELNLIDPGSWTVDINWYM